MEEVKVLLIDEINKSQNKKSFSTIPQYWEGRLKLAKELLTKINELDGNNLRQL